MRTRPTRRGFTIIVGACAFTARGLLGLAYGFDIADQSEPLRWTYISLSTLSFTAWMSYLLQSGPVTHPYRKDPPEPVPPCTKCARRRAMRTRFTERGFYTLLGASCYPTAALLSALAELRWLDLRTTFGFASAVCLIGAVIATCLAVAAKGPLTKRLHPDENTEH